MKSRFLSTLENLFFSSPSMNQAPYVLRGTHGDGPFSHPTAILDRGGFFSRGKDPSISNHLQCPELSDYISTTLSEHVAMKFTRPNEFISRYNGYLHTIRYPEFTIPVPSIIEKMNSVNASQSTTRECEYAAIGSIPASDVQVSSRVITSESGVMGIFSGEPFINPAYLPRNYSFNLLSADEAEWKLFRDVLQPLLSEDKRFFTYSEAQQISPALRDAMKQYVMTDHTPQFFIDIIADTGSEERKVERICENYHAFMRSHEVEPVTKLPVTYLSLFSSSTEKAPERVEFGEDDSPSPSLS